MNKIVELICRLFARASVTPKQNLPVRRLVADGVNNVRLRALLLKSK